MNDEKLIELAQEASAEWRDPDYWEFCPECEGKDEDCQECDGSGWREL